MLRDEQKLHHRDWRRIRRSTCSASSLLLIIIALSWFFASVALAYQQPEPPLPSDSSTNELPSDGESNSLRPLFEQLGVDESHWNFLRDDIPLGPDEYEVLYRILYRFPSLSKARIERMASWQPDWEEIADHPDLHRGDVIHLRGSLREIETFDVLHEQAILLEFKHFYRVRIELTGSGRLVDVYCRTVPKVWLAAKADRVFDEPVSADAMFLKSGETIDEFPVFALAAARVAWYPDEVDPELEVTEELRRLAGLGMDIGLFDTVRQNRPIEHKDRECFYQMLQAVGESTSQPDRGREITDTDLDGLIHRPESQRGRVVTLRGVARRVQRIDVPDDIEERFGITHYYEVDLLYVLKEGVVVYKSEDNEDRNMNHYPFVFCCRELPKGMPEGDAVREPVVVTGYYYKLYSYRSELMNRGSSGSKQECPLLIGHSFEWIQPEIKKDRSGTLLIGCLFLVVILGLWVVVWRYQRDDREFQRTTLDRQFLPPEGFSLDDIDLESKQKLDRDESE